MLKSSSLSLVNWIVLSALWEDFACCDRLNMFEDFGTVVAIGAHITDSNQNILQDDKAGSVFERGIIAQTWHRAFQHTILESE